MNRKSVDDRIVEFDATWDDGVRLDMKLEGGRHEVKVSFSAVGRHQVLIDQMPHTLFTARDESGVWVWSRGRARLVREVKGHHGHVPTEQPDDGRITPPMPAVVSAILAKAGDSVKKGQELVVVTAMKMETRLAAGRAGVVTAVNTEVGASVMPGDVLIEVRPDGEVDDGG
ncbi:MAG: hypothetical protein GXP54_09640 [Deltaproteobacteria bacterium]|nr:hypothetical protein [Deltaproteobacteria bacterium]